MQAASPGPIRLVNLTLGYDRRPAVHHLEGEIRPGAALAVCGPNGAGKSTLLKALAGLLAPLGGRVDRGGSAARDIAYLPQLVEVDRSFPINLRDFIAMGSMCRVGLFGRVGAKERARVAQAIARVGLSGMEDRPIDTLSGGQMQRVLFARLIVQDQRVILLDEPFGAIDESTTEDLLALIAEWRTEGRTVVAVLHELDLARRAFPEAMLLARECIAWGETRATLCAANLARARAMSEAHDRQARECLRDEEGQHVH
ncbi:MAG: ABC transporter [Methylocystis sp.]|nr:MAG: ABC transporter [Methylocystis sp.]